MQVDDRYYLPSKIQYSDHVVRSIWDSPDPLNLYDFLNIHYVNSVQFFAKLKRYQLKLHIICHKNSSKNSSNFYRFSYKI